MCSENKLEDELHFLLECHAYDRIRIGFINFHKISSPQTDNFIRMYHVRTKTPLTLL